MSAKRLSQIADPTSPTFSQASLFTTSEKTYNPYPRLVTTSEEVREIMRRGAEEGKIGCDLEFNASRPTIFGAACKDSAGAVRWDSSLASECLELAEKSGAVIVGHSTIGAEKQQFEKELGITTPVSIWGCSMIGHHLVNGHLTKLAGKSEEEDAGSLGLMGLSTVTSLETDLPAYKYCRGNWCEGPCPRCLRGESLVWLADGRKERIAKLVKDKYAGEVICADENGNLTTSRVTAWHRTPRNGRKFYRVSYKDYIGKSTHNYGTVMTEDHPVLTGTGYVTAGNLTEKDFINTGTPGFSEHQGKFLVGLLLGDSHIRKSGKFSICHGQEQVLYLDEKVRLLSQWKTTRHISLSQNVEGNWAATNEFELTPVWRHINKQWRTNWYEFVKRGFTLESLAIWYLDDGSYHRYQSSISVKSYTEEERDFLCSVILEKTGIPTSHRNGTIIFPAVSAKLLAAGIAKYTPACVRYKLYPLPGLDEFNALLFDSNWAGETYYSSARTAETKGRTNWNNGNEVDNNVYCLSVEKYENFATQAGIVHNCRVWDYCAIDAWGSLIASYNQEKEMASLGIPPAFYRDCLELTDICMDMEKGGLNIDREWVKHMDKLGTEFKNTLFPFELINKKPVYKEFNPKAAPQITEYFLTKGISLKDSTKQEIASVLEKVAKKEGIYGETIKDLCENLELAPELSSSLDCLYRLYQFKDAGKGVKSWFDDKYYGKDGRIHPRFITTGTSTGRLSSSRPNFQNLGARGWAKQLKKAIIPDPGYDFVESDWSQLELRIILYLAGFDVSQIPLDAFDWLVTKAPGAFDKTSSLMAMPPRDVAKSISHGCLTEDHDVLTPEGWIPISSWAGEDIATWSHEGKVTFTQPLRYIKTEATETINFTGETINQRVTLDHKLPAYDITTKRWKDYTAQDVRRFAPKAICSKYACPYTTTYIKQKVKVYCFTTTTGYFMVRRNNTISVTGNSNYLEGLQIKTGQELESASMRKEISEGARVVYTKKNYPKLTHDWTFRGGYVTFTGANLADRIFGSATLENRRKAHEIIEGIYFKEFFGIREWQMRVLAQAESGLVKSPTGRVLKLHGTPADDAKMAVSFFGQGVGADHARSVILWRKRNEGLTPILSVHDSIIQQVPKDWSDAKAKEIMASMQHETPLLPGFVNPGKVKRGPNYGDIELI